MIVIFNEIERKNNYENLDLFFYSLIFTFPSFLITLYTVDK